eukprot:10754162-Ditylum_brightwellii.AAC.1
MHPGITGGAGGSTMPPAWKCFYSHSQALLHMNEGERSQALFTLPCLHEGGLESPSHHNGRGASFIAHPCAGEFVACTEIENNCCVHEHEKETHAAPKCTSQMRDTCGGRGEE